MPSKTDGKELAGSGALSAGEIGIVDGWRTLRMWRAMVPRRD